MVERLPSRVMATATTALLVATMLGHATPTGAASPAAPAPPAFVIHDTSRDAFSAPKAGLIESVHRKFIEGRAQFNEKWAVAPEPRSAWGLGPTFNENRCSECHNANGRAPAPAEGAEIMDGALVRLSLPGPDKHGAPRPHPAYGTQLQTRGITGYEGGEGSVFVHYAMHTVAYPDGRTVELRAPRLRFAALKFGPLGPDVMTSLRIAPQLIGLGLLQAVPERALQDIAARQPALGVTGRPNRVWSVENERFELGRFGWKAGQPNLRQQIAAAFLHDIGATSYIFPDENCPPAQLACKNLPSVSNCASQHDCTGYNGFWVHPYRPEVERSRMSNMIAYLANLAVPARRFGDREVQVGATHFETAGCASCHWPELPLDQNVATENTIRPYTDLLLHDMGPGLADGRSEFTATGAEWRTPPLWGLGLLAQVNGATQLLHDGRARTLEEAILWHGGEAAAARDRFMALTLKARRALMQFVESL